MFISFVIYSKLFSYFKVVKVVITISFIFLLGHIVTDFRVENISKTSLDHKIQSIIIAEVDEIEIRGREKNCF
jgi:hypothetical protein